MVDFFDVAAFFDVLLFFEADPADFFEVFLEEDAFFDDAEAFFDDAEAFFDDADAFFEADAPPFFELTAPRFAAVLFFVDDFRELDVRATNFEKRLFPPW